MMVGSLGQIQIGINTNIQPVKKTA